MLSLQDCYVTFGSNIVDFVKTELTPGALTEHAANLAEAHRRGVQLLTPGPLDASAGDDRRTIVFDQSENKPLVSKKKKHSAGDAIDKGTTKSIPRTMSEESHNRQHGRKSGADETKGIPFPTSEGGRRHHRHAAEWPSQRTTSAKVAPPQDIEIMVPHGYEAGQVLTTRVHGKKLKIKLPVGAVGGQKLKVRFGSPEASTTSVLEGAEPGEQTGLPEPQAAAQETVAGDLLSSPAEGERALEKRENSEETAVDLLN